MSDPALAAQGLGQFTVQDVYEGLGPTVARGRAKFLQVSQEVPPLLEFLSCGKYRSTHPPFTDFYATPVHKVTGPAHAIVTRTGNALGAHAFRQGSAAAGSNGAITVTERVGWPSYVAKAVLGTVPVEADGSANFTAPAGRVLYFQLLDENYNELQRMRSVIQLQPGERRSCVGCHEDRLQLPVMRQTTMALAQPVRALAKEAHKDVKLSAEGRRALTAWVDLNCPLWPDYQYRPDRPAQAPAAVAGGR